MREIDLLAVAHDEHEGLLTVGASERAHGGCRVSRGSQARAWAAVGTARKPWARVGDPRGGLKATKALTLEPCQLSSGSPTVSLSADSAELGSSRQRTGYSFIGERVPTVLPVSGRTVVSVPGTQIDRLPRPATYLTR